MAKDPSEKNAQEFTVQEMNRNGFKDRMRVLLEGRSARAFASAAGIPATTFNKIANGQSEPTRPTLIAIARAAGVSLDWLATGEGAMRPSGSAASVASNNQIDEDLMGRIVEGISKVYKEMGARISPRDLGIAAARMASDLVEAYENPEERLGAIPALLQQLRRELRSAPNNNDSSKRLA